MSDLCMCFYVICDLLLCLCGCSYGNACTAYVTLYSFLVHLGAFKAKTELYLSNLVIYRTSEYHVCNGSRHILGFCHSNKQLCVCFLPCWCHSVLSHAAINFPLFLPACFKSGVYVATPISGHCFLIQESWGGVA